MSGGHGADPHRLPQEAVIVAVGKKLLPVRQRERACLDTCGDESEEGVDRHHRDRKQQEKDQQQQYGRYQDPRQPWIV